MFLLHFLQQIPHIGLVRRSCIAQMQWIGRFLSYGRVKGTVWLQKMHWMLMSSLFALNLL